MKNLAIVITTIFILAGISANAQMHQGGNQQQGMMMQGKGMMQGGMMHNMMGGQQMPMKKYMRMVHMLPNMKEQLSLSQDQVEQLIDMQTSFKKQQVDYKADLTKKRMKLQNMMMNDASANDIKSQLQTCSTTKINMKVAAYETANNMKSVLTEEQRDNLQNMMQNMMMQQGGMQQGGMMKNRMNQ